MGAGGGDRPKMAAVAAEVVGRFVPYVRRGGMGGGDGFCVSLLSGQKSCKIREQKRHEKQGMKRQLEAHGISDESK
jgi:hypothetical protein